MANKTFGEPLRIPQHATFIPTLEGLKKVTLSSQTLQELKEMEQQFRQDNARANDPRLAC